MNSIIWKNRANFILGLLIIFTIFSGLPDTLRETVIVALSFLVVVFGFAGSRFIGVTPLPPINNQSSQIVNNQNSDSDSSSANV